MMLARSVYLVLASLVLLTASLAAEEPKTPPRPRAEVIEAWKKAGFEFGWYGRSRYEGYTGMNFDPSSRRSGLHGERPELPAFSPAVQLPEQFGALPAPGTPFALNLSGTMVRMMHKSFKNTLAKELPVGSRDIPPPKVMSNARLKELRGLAGLTALDLSGTDVTDEGLKELAGLNLTLLNLSDTKVTDAGLKELKGLKALRRLGLRNTRVTDMGLKELTGLENLTGLDLLHTKVTDRGMTALASLNNLTELDLSVTQVSDEGLRELQGLKGLTWLSLGTRATGAALTAFENLTELDLSGTQVSDARLKELSALTNLTHLYLGATQVTDAGLKELSTLTRLTHLNLNSTQVTDAGLQELAGLTSLVDLSLERVRITGVGLRKLERLRNLQWLHFSPQDTTDDVLRALREAGLLHTLSWWWGFADPPQNDQEIDSCSLGGTKVTDEGLKELKGLTGLKYLFLHDTRVTDSGLKELNGLNNLTSLGLSGTQVTDAGLKELDGFNNLSSLYLKNTQVTDAGLEELKGLKKLTTLDLTGTPVTAAGVSELQKALPQCKIEGTPDKGKDSKTDIPWWPLGVVADLAGVCSLVYQWLKSREQKR